MNGSNVINFYFSEILATFFEIKVSFILIHPGFYGLYSVMLENMDLIIEDKHSKAQTEQFYAATAFVCKKSWKMKLTACHVNQ